MREVTMRQIFYKTGGICHFCGDELELNRRGWAKNLQGRWEVDHIRQRGKGGRSTTDNYLPACTRCNRLRWHRTGEGIRELLELGTIAAHEIDKDSELGTELVRLRLRRRQSNRKRRQASA